MEVKPGYKQTEVGVIPVEWEVESLGCIGRVIRGSSPRPKGDRRFYGGNVPRLMVEDVTRDRKYVTPTIDFLTVEGAKLSRPCKKGTLTVVCSGTPTVVGLPSILAVDACIHDGMLGLVHLSPSVEPEYLFYRLTDLQEQLHAAATHGGTFVNLTTKGFGAFTIAIPPQPEQRAIATALSDVDGLLGGLDRLIAKKRDLKQAAMQQLLTGQTRLPGFHGQWDVKRLGELANIRMCKRIFAEQTYTSGDIPFFKIGTFGKEPDAFITESLYEEYRNKYSFPAKGDILLSAAGTLGRTVIYDGQPAYFQDSNIVWLEINKTLLCNEYLNYCYQVIAWASPEGSTIPRLYNAIIRDSAISLPLLPEQTAIASVLSEMDGELAVLEQRREKTFELKQAMMQELLTGRTRLV